MPLIDLDYDLKDVKSEFEPLPIGDYVAKIETCELVKSKTDKDMLKVRWAVTEGEFEGRKLFDNVVLTVPWKTKQYAVAAGIESGSQINSSDFINTEGILSVTQREYQGSIQNQINTVKPIG